jgi:conjugal transfer/entry exclusion protein
MSILTLTHICLLIIVISMMVISVAVFAKYITDLATKRAKRKTQRDRNSQHIELAELQLAQMEERIACMENTIQQLKK